MWELNFIHGDFLPHRERRESYLCVSLLFIFERFEKYIIVSDNQVPFFLCAKLKSQLRGGSLGELKTWHVTEPWTTALAHAKLHPTPPIDVNQDSLLLVRLLYPQKMTEVQISSPVSMRCLVAPKRSLTLCCKDWLL